jgi:hypothetical protein
VATCSSLCVQSMQLVLVYVYDDGHVVNLDLGPFGGKNGKTRALSVTLTQCAS